jgi:acyl-coenzyme A synthetase/AMP-(fatty) acid ligase
MSSLAVKSIPNILNREIIDREIYWYDNEHTHHANRDIGILTNRWKHLLHHNGAVKGNLVTISMFTVDMIHVSAIFACAEMGLKIIILDSPATKESLPYTKLALHGPSDFYLHHGDNHMSAYDGLHGEMLRRYGGKSVSVEDLGDMSSEDFVTDKVYPDDPLLMSSTSGTTKPSRPVLFSHKEVMTISRRNVDVFKFDENSKVVHSRNLHHASAMLTSLIPSLMVSNHHLTFPLSHTSPITQHHRDMGFYNRLREDEYTHIMIANKHTLMDFLETYQAPFKSKLHINMCGFALDQSFVELAERYNVSFHSHYGSIDTAIPLLVNFVDKDSVVKDNSLGILPDDFYQLNGDEVTCELWDEPRYIEDQLKYKDGEFFIKPRKENTGRYIMEITRGLDIDIDLFFQDTKLNYEQLRGHIQEVKKKYDKS